MGIDALELAMRLEDEFKIVCDNKWFAESFGKQGFANGTAGGLHFHVGCAVAQTGGSPPPDAWERIQKVLSEVTGVPPKDIHPESRLLADLGLT